MLFPISLPGALVIGLLPVHLSPISSSSVAQSQVLNLSKGPGSIELVTRNGSRAKSGIDFSGDGRSGTRNGGGSRSECPSVDAPLTALMPSSNIGITIATRPQFWLYIPYTPEQAPVGEFIIQDTDRNDIYRATITLPDTPGLASLMLTDTVPELSLEQDYRWYVNLYCDADKASSPIFVQGWVQRVSIMPSLEAQLASTPPERVDLIYAENRIWFDAIASLANYRMADPSNSELLEDWNALLNAPGVELDLPDSLTFSGPVTLTEAVR